MDDRTEGPVNGRALHGEYVHNSRTNRVYLVKEHHGGGLYDLKPVGRKGRVTAELNGEEWTFYPQPDLVVMTTRDSRGNEHTWRLGGIPAFATEELNTRRVLKRHWLKYGVPNALVTIDPDWYWTAATRG